MDGLKELLAGCEKEQVAGISFGGQMHGLVILDKNDQVIRRRFSGTMDEPGRNVIT